MNLIEVTYGQELFDTGNAKVSVFAAPCKLFNTFDAEMAIEIASRKDNIPVERQGSLNIVSAWHTDARAELGRWTTAAYVLPEGMLLKVFAHKHSGHGERTLNLCQFIRIRPEAAYQEIKIKLTGHAKARKNTVSIKGRFDLLTLEEARKLGAKVKPQFEGLYNSRDFGRMIEVIVLEKAKPPTKIFKERVRRRKDGTKEVQQVQRKVRTLALDDED